MKTQPKKDFCNQFEARKLLLSRLIWVAKSAVCQAINVFNPQRRLVILILSLCIFMVMIDRELMPVMRPIFITVSNSLNWLLRALGGLLLRRLCSSLRFAALVTTVGIGAFLIHSTQTEKEKKKKSRVGNPGINEGAAPKCLEESALVPTTSDERKAADEVQEILSKRPIYSSSCTTGKRSSNIKHSRSRSYISCDDSSLAKSHHRALHGDAACTENTKILDHSKLTASRKTRTTSNSCDCDWLEGKGIDAISVAGERVDVISPPLPPLEVLLQENPTLLHDIEQSLAPWRQTDYGGRVAHHAPLVPAEAPEAPDSSSSPYTASCVKRSCSDPDHVDEQSDEFIRSRQQQWRLQMLMSLQRATNTSN